MKKKGYLFVLMAAMCWATLGLFGNTLMSLGLIPEQVAFLRLFVGFLILTIYALIKNPTILKINKKGFIFALLVGLVCQAGFNMFYFNYVKTIGVSLSTVLVYTSPLFIALFSRIIYKEKIDNVKKVSLALCFIGAFIAVTNGRLDFKALNGFGLLLGVGSSITYSFMPIISKTALKYCDSVTLIIYGFLFGAILMLPIAKPVDMINCLANPKALIFSLSLGVVTAALAYIFYLKGIDTGIDLSLVGVLASVELVISSVLGWTILSEDFSFIKLFGVCLMMVSAYIATKSSSDESVQDEYETAC